MMRKPKYKPPTFRPIPHDPRQHDLPFDPAANIPLDGDAPHAAQDFWNAPEQRYELLGGTMVRLYGAYDGESCGTCTNYQYGRCVAYSDRQGGWSRAWPACGAWCMTDQKDRAALRGFTVSGGQADGDAVPTPAAGGDSDGNTDE